MAIQKENLLKYSSELHEDGHQNSYLMTQVENGTYLTTQVENGSSYYRKVPQEVGQCHSFTSYLIDPNKNGALRNSSINWIFL